MKVGSACPCPGWASKPDPGPRYRRQRAGHTGEGSSSRRRARPVRRGVPARPWAGRGPGVGGELVWCVPPRLGSAGMWGARPRQPGRGQVGVAILGRGQRLSRGGARSSGAWLVGAAGRSSVRRSGAGLGQKGAGSRCSSTPGPGSPHQQLHENSAR